jgi:glutamate-1-semialdehyde 2,1-aminomutase
MTETRALSLFESAKQFLPGGVCSSTRLNKALGRPVYAQRGAGARVWDVDDNELIDLCTSHGASILGHKHPAIVAAMQQAADLGVICSFETEFHVELARLICEVIPCAERVRFTHAGTEATMHALRACRAFTGRDKIIRFEGHFHGYHDYVFIGGHAPREYLETPHARPYLESAGIPEGMADYVISIPFNDPELFKQTLERHAHEACCVILEPVNFNWACVQPKPGFLELLREETRRHNVLLFFDEIQDAFKRTPGGTQEWFNVTPDVATIGKSLGGGLPLSAFVGRADVMDTIAPVGKAAHSGTFNGTLSSILASLAFIHEVRKPGFYAHLESLEAILYPGLQQLFVEHGILGRIQHFGQRFNIIFGVGHEVTDYRSGLGHNTRMMLDFVREAHAAGVYFHDYGGAPCHHGFSIAHTREDIEEVLNRLDGVCARLGRQAYAPA